MSAILVNVALIILWAQQSNSWVLPGIVTRHRQEQHAFALPSWKKQQRQHHCRQGYDTCQLFSSSSSSSSSSNNSPDTLFSLNGLGNDEVAWKQQGEQIILKAAVEAGAKPEMIRIEWKSGQVVITVDGSAYIPADFDGDNDDNENICFDEIENDEDDVSFEEDEEDEEDEDFIEYDDEDFDDEENSFDNDFIPSNDDDGDSLNLVELELQESPGSDIAGAVDVVAIARAINQAFDSEGEGSVGYNIAVHHEIEVTTPGATDELSGMMFESYKGFDVIVEFRDAKTGKTKKVEGKLVERDDEVTRINERGRMRNFKNELVESVKLPKAKSEKGLLSSSGNKKSSSKKKPKKKRK